MFVTVCFIAVADDYSSVNNIRIGEFNVTIPLYIQNCKGNIHLQVFLWKYVAGINWTSHVVKLLGPFVILVKK